MIFINEREVRENLSMEELSSDLEIAFRDCGKGDAIASSRDRIYTGSSFLNTMPAYWKRYGISGLKTYYAGKNGVKFVVIIFQDKNPEDFFVVEADRLGQMRTGALPGVVTKNTGIKGDFLLIGSGYQAETQMEAMVKILGLEKAWVYSRNPSHARNFAEKMSSTLNTDIEVVENLQNLERFSIITTMTSSKDPVIREKIKGDEFHLNLVGANLMNRSEASPEVMNSADLIIVEHLEQAMKESAEIMSVNDKNKIVELKAFMNGKESKGKRTIFKSMGIGLEDIVAARIVAKNMGYLR